MNTKLIEKMFEEIKAEVSSDEELEYREVVIVCKDLEDTNVIISKESAFEVDESALYIKYKNNPSDDFYFRQLIDLAQIINITDEV